MATQRRSITALNLLKAQHENRIKNYHRPAQKKLVDEARAKSHAEAKKIIEDIEKYAISRYPQLKMLLKCESGNSNHNNDRVQVVFKFEASGVQLERSRLAKLKRDEENDLAQLAAWYTRFLETSAGGEDVPVFRPKHLEGVSSDVGQYYYESYLTI